MEMNNRIGIIGTGKLGLAFGLLCESKGYEVMGMDNRQEYVNSLNDKSFKTTEPLVTEYLQHSTNFQATTNLKQVIEFADLLYIFVATPSMSNGKYSHNAIDEVINSIWKIHSKGSIDLRGKTFVLGSTVMPGYTNSITPRLEAMGSEVAYNPEFIAQGSIINDLIHADMILIGSKNESVIDKLISLYISIMGRGPRFNTMSFTAAEICKISINCFLATKIAFTNMIGEIATNSEVGNEAQTILNAMGDDTRVGKRLITYGFGYGGPCIPRDGRALGIHAEEVGVEARICQTTDTANNLHARYLKNYFIEQNPDKSIPFLFTQLSYKKGVDILTESQQYKLCENLLDEGYSVCIEESPEVVEQLKTRLVGYENKITYSRTETFYEIIL